MKVVNWIEQRMQTLKWYDISLTKLSTFFFVLMLAKLWQPILSMNWQTYLVLALVFAIRPLYQFYLRDRTPPRSVLVR